MSWVQAAALKLAYMEYADLVVSERLALLQGLLEMALEVEAIREYVSAQVEAMAPLSKREARQEVSLHALPSLHQACLAIFTASMSCHLYSKHDKKIENKHTC